MSSDNHKCKSCGKLYLPTQGENIIFCKKCAIKATTKQMRNKEKIQEAIDFANKEKENARSDTK